MMPLSLLAMAALRPASMAALILSSVLAAEYVVQSEPIDLHHAMAPGASWSVGSSVVASGTTSSETSMPRYGLLSPNTTRLIPSKHFFKCGWTSVTSFVSDKIDKSSLPKAMQVRKDKFGKVGQTKWTHLSAEDTTYANQEKGEHNAWTDKNDANLKKLEQKRAGMKGYEKRLARREAKRAAETAASGGEASIDKSSADQSKKSKPAEERPKKTSFDDDAGDDAGDDAVACSTLTAKGDCQTSSTCQWKASTSTCFTAGSSTDDVAATKHNDDDDHDDDDDDNDDDDDDDNDDDDDDSSNNNNNVNDGGDDNDNEIGRASCRERV